MLFEHKILNRTSVTMSQFDTLNQLIDFLDLKTFQEEPYPKRACAIQAVIKDISRSSPTPDYWSFSTFRSSMCNSIRQWNTLHSENCPRCDEGPEHYQRVWKYHIFHIYCWLADRCTPTGPFTAEELFIEWDKKAPQLCQTTVRHSETTTQVQTTDTWDWKTIRTRHVDISRRLGVHESAPKKQLNSGLSDRALLSSTIPGWQRRRPEKSRPGRLRRTRRRTRTNTLWGTRGDWHPKMTNFFLEYVLRNTEDIVQALPGFGQTPTINIWSGGTMWGESRKVGLSATAHSTGNTQKSTETEL